MQRARAFDVLLLLAVLLLACVPPASAQGEALPPGVVRGPSVEGITEYRFANGLRAVLFPDASKPTITVNVTYLVGSRHEGYGETGMAHLLEHMLFKGTPKRPHLVEEFATRGARRNGTTNVDRTNYFETFPASEDNLSWALDLESDRMVHSNIARSDLDSEMTVVRNEYERGENEPYAVLVRRLQGVAYDWHNYQNATIGNRSDIENVGIDNLRAFYRIYYQPDNAVLVVAGRFDPAFALKTIAATFGTIPRPTRTLPTLWTVEPDQDGERTFSVRRKGDVSIVVAGYKVPSGRHEDAAALMIAASVLGMTPGGRLHAQLVETGKAVSVSGNSEATMDPGLIRFSAVVKAGASIDEVQATLVRTVEEFGVSGPTEAEVRRARAAITRQREEAFSSTENFALLLSSSIAQGDWRLFFYMNEHLARVSAADVKAAAARYLRRDNRTVGLFIPTDAPQRAHIEATPPADALLASFKGREAEDGAESFDPTPAHIDARTRHVTLASGLKVALLAKPARGQEVHLRLHLGYGDMASLRGHATAQVLMGPMLTRGTSRMTRQEISDRMDELRMSGSIAGETSTLRTTRENLPEAVALMAHVLKDASFPPAELEQLRNQALTGLLARRTDVAALAIERLGRNANVFEPDDPRYVPSTDELIERVRAARREEIVAVHELMGTSYGELAIVGDFDPDAIVPVLERELGTWRSRHPYARIDGIYRDVKPIDDTIMVADKASATFAAQLLLKTRDDDPAHPEYPALVLANYVLGGGAGFSSRLFTRIRGKEGLTYGVSTSLANNSLDEVTVFSAAATAAPANLPRVEVAFREELARLVQEGLTDQELADAKKGLIQQRIQSRASDATLAAFWADKMRRGTTFAETAEYDRKLEAVSREDVLAAVRMHLDPARVSVVKVGSLPAPAKVP